MTRAKSEIKAETKRLAKQSTFKLAQLSPHDSFQLDEHFMPELYRQMAARRALRHGADSEIDVQLTSLGTDTDGNSTFELNVKRFEDSNPSVAELDVRPLIPSNDMSPHIATNSSKPLAVDGEPKVDEHCCAEVPDI